MKLSNKTKSNIYIALYIICILIIVICGFYIGKELAQPVPLKYKIDGRF